VRRSINVFILTFCQDLKLFYGTELIFKTLRVGFPNVRITVIDNASLPEACEQIRILAKQNDCIFQHHPRPGIEHHEFIQNSIRLYADTGLSETAMVFLDPDICLWKNCEDFDFNGIIAGILTGGFTDSITQSLDMPRLHTSFLWIPDAGKLQDEIRKMKARHFDFEPFRPFSFRLKDTWYRYDTGAGLYNAMPNKVSIFTEEHQTHYDHIFSGSHIDVLNPLFSGEVRQLMMEVHSHAKKGELDALRGIHKLIDKRWWEIHERIAL
jgi:hypothetical protein